MNNISFLLLGAGRSAYTAIEYLAAYCAKNSVGLTVADAYINPQLSLDFAETDFVLLDINESDKLAILVQKATIVISLLPPDLHILVADQCLVFKRDLVTASYISPQMEALDARAKAAKLLFLCECGLDPGLDHLSIMAELEFLKYAEADIISLKSYCGGLASLASAATNPWGYKISWNPRNIVLAGQSTAQYLDGGQPCFAAPSYIFSHPLAIELPEWGGWDAYPNRNSLTYIQAYGLDQIQTMIRGTLRPKGYCKAWDVLVKIGLTQEDPLIDMSENMSWRALCAAFLPADYKSIPPKTAWQGLLKISPQTLEKLDFLGIFEPIPIVFSGSKASPAQLLQILLEEKWKLSEQDTDLVLMAHEFEYYTKNQAKIQKMQTWMALEGQNQYQTAMAKTVGLPLAMAACLMAEKKFLLTGVHRPTDAQIYKPLLAQLAREGIVFKKKILEM